MRRIKNSRTIASLFDGQCHFIRIRTSSHLIDHTLRQSNFNFGQPTGEPRHVRRIGSLVSQLISRRGYAKSFANEELQRVIGTALGEQLQSAIKVGNLRNGVLQVFASDSVTLQELNFQKRKILKSIQEELPEDKVTDLRFRIQT
jgi:predicted nucleic acid-binding Zn ribbon protein